MKEQHQKRHLMESKQQRFDSLFEPQHLSLQHC